MRKLIRKERAQGMVEFALIIPIVLVVVFGIIEFGRLLFTYSVVFTSSREAARYGAAAGNAGGFVPYYLDCTGIKAAGTRMGSLAGITDSDILIRYDHGSDASRFSNVCPPDQGVKLGDRIEIQVQTTYQPIVPLLNIPAFPISSNTARTILKDIHIAGTPQAPPSPGTPDVMFAEETQEVTEDSAGTVTVQLDLSYAITDDVTVPFSLSGSADDGVGLDYTYSPLGVVTIPAGSTQASISISVNPDTMDEYDETIVITMGNPTNANKGAPDTHTITILDDDDPPIARFTSEDSTVNGLSHTIFVQLDAASGKDISIPFSANVISSTASLGTDYNFDTSSPLSIPAGGTGASIEVTIVDDLIDEEDEEAFIVMDDPTNAERGTPYVHVMTIPDNDPPPTVAFALAAQDTSEDVDLNVELQLSAPSGKEIIVPYNLEDISATRNVDYTVANGPVVFAPGETTASIIVSAILDLDDEGEAGEVFKIHLQEPTNAGLGTPSTHTVTILDPVKPEVFFEQETGAEAEGNGGMTVGIQLSSATPLPVQVPLTITGTATEGDDYTIPSLGITIPAGNTSQDVVINVVVDGLDEEDETVILTMGLPTNAVLGSPSQHTATILDDDLPPIVYFVPESQSGHEDKGDMPVTVNLTSASGLDVLVPFTLGGSATPGEDYNTLSPSNSLVIPAGSTDGTLLIQVIDDDALDTANIGEGDETAIITIDNPVNATIDLSQVLPYEHTATILAWDCPSAASNPYFGVGYSKKMNWDIQYSGVRSVNLLGVYIEWPATKGTKLQSTTFGGQSIGDPAYYPATLGSLDVIDPTPLWTGVFATRQMIFEFNKTPTLEDGDITVTAVFEHCLPFAKGISN